MDVFFTVLAAFRREYPGVEATLEVKTSIEVAEKVLSADATFGVVESYLPDPRLRLRLDDKDRVSELARRYAPARCLAMDHGARIWIDGGRVARTADVKRLDPDGSVDPAWVP